MEIKSIIVRDVPMHTHWNVDSSNTSNSSVAKIANSRVLTAKKKVNDAKTFTVT